ncbi:MAG: hypothetical protein NXI20_11050 [bacterium]|nr:hypothetical protein [bacterium]
MRLFKKNKGNADLNFESFPSIERKMVVKGRFVPGVINNGGNYFFVNLEVFEDGLIDCWETVDLELFRGKVDSGWVTPIIPNEKNLSIHHLGSWLVKNGEWNFNRESYFDHIRNVIKDLNPEMKNLYNCFGTTTKKIGQVNVSVLGMARGKPVRREKTGDYFSPKHNGDSFHAFRMRSNSEYDLVSINIFADSRIQISGIEQPELLSIEEFRNLVEAQVITTEIPENSKVHIYGLGKCTVGECQYSTDINEKVSEINDIIAELNGKKTSLIICHEIYDEYLSNPTVKLRDSLKVAYEKIPLHLRTYVLGDMDTKDIPVRMIIYGDKEIENWSHYLIAKQEGYELPQLNVPKPKDE